MYIIFIPLVIVIGIPFLMAVILGFGIEIQEWWNKRKN